jgi:hypothetical protein
LVPGDQECQRPGIDADGVSASVWSSAGSYSRPPGPEHFIPLTELVVGVRELVGIAQHDHKEGKKVGQG